MSVTQADIKASGEIAVSPLINRVRGGSTISSDEAKEAFKGHETDNRPRGTGHGIDPSGHNATFETFGDDAYYTPIDNYEGRHRYDPKFEWEPHEERKLVRKVGRHPNNIIRRHYHSMLTDLAGSPHLLLGLSDVLCSST